MSQKAPRIPNQIWNRHKDAIIAFYSANPLHRTIDYMAENHGFRASENQYTTKLKAWGIEKYNSGHDWALVQSQKRKRGREGKESDVYIRGRKYSRREVEKEIARHVPCGQQLWCSSDNILPDYITVCTPTTEVAETRLPGMNRDSLIRDLPWLQCTTELQSLVSGLERSIFSSAPGSSLELITRELFPQSGCDLLQLRLTSGLQVKTAKDLDPYLPPGDLDIGNYSPQRPSRLRNKSPFSSLKIFLQRFIFLSANNILGQMQFDKVCDRIVERGGADILVSLCQLRSPLMEVFAEKVFCSAFVSGNICLGRRLLQCGILLPTDNRKRRHWAEYLSSAVLHGHEAVVKLLLEAGVCPEIRGFCLWTRKWDLRLPILQTLLDFGASPETFITDQAIGYPLVDAALDGSLGAVKLLLDKGARVNLYLPDYYGTALQAAASQGHLEVVKYLIQHGADIDVPFGSQIQFPHSVQCFFCTDKKIIPLLTPVQIAAKIDNVGVLQILLQQGASTTACPASAQPNFNRFRSCSAKEHTYWRNSQRIQPQFSTCNKCSVHTALQYGVINQNLEIVRLVLSTGVAPDFRVAPVINDTPLQMSTRLGNAEMFRLLWSYGADLDAPPAACNGRTAMQGAAESGNLEILLMLLHAGAQINAPAGAEQGMTALQAACLNGHPLIAGVLHAHGADLNAGPSALGGLTPIQAAAVHGDMGLVKDLITLGADVNAPATEEGMTALLAATTHSSLPLLELLVQHGADVNASADYGFLSPLSEAVKQMWPEGVQFLLEHGASVNSTPIDREIPRGIAKYHLDGLFSPLGCAIFDESEDIIDLLLQHGADVLAIAIAEEFVCRGALMHALDRGSSPRVVDLLLAKVPHLEKHPGWENALKTVFLRSFDSFFDIDFDAHCRRQILEKVNSLVPSLRHKTLQNAWDALPPIHSNSDDNEIFLENIELLIESGAFLESRDRDGSTVFQRAARGGYDKVCSFLIDHGADVNTPAIGSWGTPLQEAIKGSHINLVNVLLERGADIDAPPAENRGVTALQAASINGMLKLTVQLLEQGADVSAPAAPRDGRTAIDGAAERGRFDMVKLILNAYADQGYVNADLEHVRRQAAGYAEREGHFQLARWLRGC